MPGDAPRPAATVVVLRPGPTGPEVLLTHRPATMAFGPGLHVFPGGALDPGDSSPRVLGRLRADGAPSVATHAGPFVVAAIRELYEEAGILLATRTDGAPVRVPGQPFAELVERDDLALRADWLVPLARWVTPPVVPRRYDTRFFVACLPQGAQPRFDDTEVVGHAWLTPRDALAAMAGGRIELWTPTATVLRQLALARGLEDVRRHLRPLADGHPPAVERVAPAVSRIRLHGAAGVPGQAVDAWMIGRRRVVVVDPGDPNDEAAHAILATARSLGATITGVLLTAPVPDHAAGAEGLALRLGIGVHAATGARELLAAPVTPIADGDLLELADVPVRAHATPGTDPDHLAFEIAGQGVVLVGDLEGPGPTRAIPEPVDARALARSRERVLGLGATARLGAHG
jgi:glyoxylase-like metal-dependent hydrolase (beta-lactamase superfamily II)/8-oxo-dGTP pyrophosphatase MutT (NUDIX family)